MLVALKGSDTPPSAPCGSEHWIVLLAAAGDGDTVRSTAARMASAAVAVAEREVRDIDTSSGRIGRGGRMMTLAGH
jgi:hypothetical protein